MTKTPPPVRAKAATLPDDKWRSAPFPMGEALILAAIAVILLLG